MSTWIHVYGWRQGAAGQGGKRGCVCGKGKETGIGTEGASGSVVSVGMYEAVNDGLGDLMWCMVGHVGGRLYLMSVGLRRVYRGEGVKVKD